MCGERQRELLDRAQRIGECDLRPLPDGRWMLDVTVELEAPIRMSLPPGWGLISAW